MYIGHPHPLAHSKTEIATVGQYDNEFVYLAKISAPAFRISLFIDLVHIDQNHSQCIFGATPFSSN